MSWIGSESIDDCDEGVYDQADCNLGAGPSGDDVLPPLLRVQKYAQSGNVYDRQMVARIVQEIFKTAPPETLSEDLSNIMQIVTNIGEKDESMVRTDLLEQIPHMAIQALNYSNRVLQLKNITSEYLLPLVVRNLGCSDNTIDKAAHSALINLIEQRLITKEQAEIQVCPAILALSKEEPTADLNAGGAIALMSRIAPLLGRDITERVFLNTFSQLCSSHLFFIRKTCASHFGEFCAVVGKEEYEKVLLPCYVELCRDEIWGVRKSCAEVIMFVSSVCPSILRRTILAPAFINLLQDDCRWVVISAFQTLGSFISTFSENNISSMMYNDKGELVFVDCDGNEFMMNSSTSVPDIRFCKFKFKTPSLSEQFLSSNDNNNDDNDIVDNDKSSIFNKWIGLQENNENEKPKYSLLNFDEDDDDESLADCNDKLHEVISDNNINNSVINNDNDEKKENLTINNDETIFNSSTTNNNESDESIKEIVETVKNAVLSYRNVEQTELQQHGIIIGKKDVNNKSYVVISDNIQSETCDNLGSTINEISDYLNNISIKVTTAIVPVEEGDYNKYLLSNSNNHNVIINENDNENITALPTSTTTTITNNKQVNLINEKNEDDDNLNIYNSYNYWYISPDIPIDLSIIDEPKINYSGDNNDGDNCEKVSNLNDSYVSINLNDTVNKSTDNNLLENVINIDANNECNNTVTTDIQLLNNKEPEQDIVPQILINHFISMPESTIAVNMDNEMSYHCAYSLPAVISTLGKENWHLLKNTLERLASNMQYKVRRTIASSLHDLAFILGPELATQDLTPIFEGFIKDLDEVRIGILKNLSRFLQFINPEKRRIYLPRLSEFLQTENDSNWRFRQELARQLVLIIKLFKPKDVAKNIALTAQLLLYDKVAAVRKEAIYLITKLIQYISKKSNLTSSLLIKLIECFAHSKNWKRRQTFALLCCQFLSSLALPLEQFSSELLPHFLDLSWDPVANVRLVVARTISQNILYSDGYVNAYFTHPENQLYDMPGILRRLSADKDRDVGSFAEG